jgi:RNA polymerase sigma-32 factor
MSSSLFASLGRRANQAGLLDEAEELRLIRSYRRNGDAAALDRLVVAHLGLIMSCAKRIPNAGQHADDLINEGVIGFIKAVENFDEAKGCRLSVIAKFHVKAHMQDFAISNMSAVQPFNSRDQRKVFFHMRKLLPEEVATGDRLMSQAETQAIAARLSVASEDVTYVAQRLAGGDLSLDRTVTNEDGDGAHLADTLADAAPHPEDELILKDEHQRWTVQVRVAMGKLPNREKFILAERRLKDPPTSLEVLAAMHGVSKGRISQIEQQAMERLKSIIAADKEAAKPYPPTRKFVHRRN